MCRDREMTGENVLFAQSYCNDIRQGDMMHTMRRNNRFFFRGLNRIFL